MVLQNGLYKKHMHYKISVLIKSNKPVHMIPETFQYLTELLSSLTGPSKFYHSCYAERSYFLSIYFNVIWTFLPLSQY